MAQRLYWSVILIGTTLACINARIATEAASSLLINTLHTLDGWGTWSVCSVTCGQGASKRYRLCLEDDCKTNEETRKCHLQFCPSYLTWPRIHFSGGFVMDANTVNNNRCNYENEEFSSVAISKEKKSLVKSENHQYVFDSLNWNPGGSGHFYFENASVTSMCSLSMQCSTDEPIVGITIKEVGRAQSACIDPDEQEAYEVWGLVVEIPGIFKGTFLPASGQQTKTRIWKFDKKVKGYSYGRVGRLKSKLVNINWTSSYYKNIFKNATSLSMVITLDLFNQFSINGRMTGTIGLTSEDDPLSTTAGRLMLSNIKSNPAPLFVDRDRNVITVDLSASMPGKFDGTFHQSRIDLGIVVNTRFPFMYPREIYANIANTTSGSSVYILTKNSSVSKSCLGKNNAWYSIYGGIVDIDVSHSPRFIKKMLRNHRIVIVKRRRRQAENFLQYTIILEENKHGINLGAMNYAQKRLNVGQSHTYVTYTSMFGMPLANAEVKVEIFPNKAEVDCWFSCNRTLSYPLTAINISGNGERTDSAGCSTHEVKAVEDPGNPRGCGLDGQLYSMGIRLRYNDRKRTFTYVNGKFKKPTNVYAMVPTSIPLIRIYSQVVVKSCPTWMDVKDIFIQNYNLYPVMWQNGIIDLHSYVDLKKKARILKAALFETEFTDARYMPASRDLSLSKQMLIWNWMKCGMKFGEEIIDDTCSPSFVKEKFVELKLLVQKAIMLELATIPPYFTAWLTLKTEEGRNVKAANILKEIYTEEMLHMSLASNFLNAIGGTVNLSNLNELPVFPSNLASGSFYNILPDVILVLQRFSLGLVKDIFAAIEKPSNKDDRMELFHIAELWKILPLPSAKSESQKMNRLLEEYNAYLMNNESLQNHDTNGEHKFVADEPDYRLTLNQTIKAWRRVKSYAVRKLTSPSHLVTTIGALYCKLALLTILLESCAQLKGLENNLTDVGETSTIFVGDRNKQLNDSHWYNPHHHGLDEATSLLGSEMRKETLVHSHSMSSYTVRKPINEKLSEESNLTASLFPITDLRSAIQAVIEIVYQGEGGSACSPFRSSKIGKELTMDRSHYAKFLEIANGRHLIVKKTPSPVSSVACLNFTDSDCPDDLEEGESYCFLGDEIPFYEDGVWPTISNPSSNMYAEGTDVRNFNHQFNLAYTRLLLCLQKAFGGSPSKIQSCMSNMYDLVIIGKKLVRTPLGVLRDTKDNQPDCFKRNATPTWEFLRDPNSMAGDEMNVQ